MPAAMKLVRSIHPKNLFSLKKSKSRHVSKSEPASFSTVDSSSSSSSEWSAGNGGVGDLWLEVVEAFKVIDGDGDGKISKCELGMVLSRIGVAPHPTEEDLTTMLAEMDLDGDGCISLEELQAIRSAFAPVSGMEELRETFDVFDADHDGSISAEELLSVFSAIGDERCTIEECRRMIESVDVNGDGFVCFQDFTRMMELQHQQLQC